MSETENPNLTDEDVRRAEHPEEFEETETPVDPTAAPAEPTDPTAAPAEPAEPAAEPATTTGTDTGGFPEPPPGVTT